VSGKSCTLVVGLAALLGAIVLFISFQPASWQSEGKTRRRPVLHHESNADSTTSAGHAITVGLDAEYVGSAACVRCHAEECASFRQTGMGRSLAIVDETVEPPDGEIAHALSGRRFDVHRENGKLHHRETLASDSAHQVLADYPAKFVVGSGSHSRSYLMEVDGFLVESPLTWYTSAQAWGMSPGYDVADHAGFRREVPEKCLFCHAGRARAMGGSLHRIEFFEHAIGCERCHGPGSTHVQRYEVASSEAGEDSSTDTRDDTIVNPARLPRDLAGDVCHQCHLTTKAYVPARDRALADFRPGLPLKEFRHYFREQNPDSSMRVVGHVEQLMLSDCYCQSDLLSCLTCHNPHAFPEPRVREQYYRNACLQCHERDACRVSPGELAERSPTNNCVTCHMPSTATDIPHFAFTHHRIGIHERIPAAQPDENSSFIDLTPFHDLSFLSPLDRTRSLGLAYFALSKRSTTKRKADEYARRGRRLLVEVKAAGLKDGEVDAALAQAAWAHDRAGSIKHARDALGASNLSPISRVNSLYALAAFYSESQQYAMALPILTQLTTLRRNAGDWMLLGDCLLASEDQTKAIAAYERAVQIDPNLVEIHTLLAEYYERTGKPEQAQKHKVLIDVLMTIMSNQVR